MFFDTIMGVYLHSYRSSLSCEEFQPHFVSMRLGMTILPSPFITWCLLDCQWDQFLVLAYRTGLYLNQPKHSFLSVVQSDQSTFYRLAKYASPTRIQHGRWACVRRYVWVMANLAQRRVLSFPNRWRVLIVAFRSVSSLSCRVHVGDKRHPYSKTPCPWVCTHGLCRSMARISPT